MLASAQKRRQFAAFGLPEFDQIAYLPLCLLVARGTDEQLNRMAGVSRSAGRCFTVAQISGKGCHGPYRESEPAACPLGMSSWLGLVEPELSPLAQRTVLSGKNHIDLD
jgi:hypothetical protein